MYDLSSFRDMILDGVRTEAYIRALTAAIRPGDVVLEIGSGVGYFAAVAARLGAAEVHAVEPNPSVFLAEELARANGVGDRVVIHHGTSEELDLPPVDVIFSDLRGILPPLGDNLATLRDARTRLLKPGGHFIPERDRLFLALADGWEREEGPPEEVDELHGIRLTPLQERLAHTWRKRRFLPEHLVTGAGCWTELDYLTDLDPTVAGQVEVTAFRPGRVRGIAAWFETELFQGVGFSAGPGPARAVYGQAWFPLPRALSLDAGDRVRVELEARLLSGSYNWGWSGEVLTGSAKGGSFRQNAFLGTSSSVAGLRKRAHTFIPHLGSEGEARRWILTAMDGTRALGEIAEDAARRFPDRFPTPRDALTLAGRLSERFSEE